MYRYLPVKETTAGEQPEGIPTCGIRVLWEAGAESREIRYVADVFTDIALGERFAVLCTREQLDPMHLLDAIEDFFS